MITKFLKKLVLGNITPRTRRRFNLSPYQKRILNIRSIWNNDHQEDSGVEKIIRLILSISQLLFPGVYIRQLAFKKGFEYEDITMDLYVLLKVLFPFLILYNGWQDYRIVTLIMVYLLLETVLYIPTLIFASDLLTKPKSYKRSMMLLFFNYLEIVLSFAVLYSIGDNMNKPFQTWFDPVYFSIITSNSIGYGDYHPLTAYGKMLVSIQTMFFLSFLVLFLNFFSAKVKIKGYFSNDVTDEEL